MRRGRGETWEKERKSESVVSGWNERETEREREREREREFIYYMQCYVSTSTKDSGMIQSDFLLSRSSRF